MGAGARSNSKSKTRVGLAICTIEIFAIFHEQTLLPKLFDSAFRLLLGWCAVRVGAQLFHKGLDRAFPRNDTAGRKGTIGAGQLVRPLGL